MGNELLLPSGPTGPAAQVEHLTGHCLDTVSVRVAATSPNFLLPTSLLLLLCQEKHLRRAHVKQECEGLGRGGLQCSIIRFFLLRKASLHGNGSPKCACHLLSFDSSACREESHIFLSLGLMQTSEALANPTNSSLGFMVPSRLRMRRVSAPHQRRRAGPGPRVVLELWVMDGWRDALAANTTLGWASYQPLWRPAAFDHHKQRLA